MNKQAEEAIYTIGYSTHPIKDFINLLKKHGITAVADVRSSPFSRHHPQFNQDALAEPLKSEGIAYVFLGEELGARPDDPTCYDNGSADFGRMSERAVFKQGIERILRGRKKYRIALLCAEKDPLDCHRTILVCRTLHKLGLPIKHILVDGSIEDHQDTERRLIKNLGLNNSLLDANLTDSERIEKAYNQQARIIAYKSNDKEGNHGPAK